MRIDTFSLVLRLTRTMLLLPAALTIGCGTVRNPALEHTRDLYRQARQDPLIVRYAGAALDRAGQTLDVADQLWTEEKDVIEVEHLAYIAEKRVEIARVTAQRRLAADEIRQSRSRRPETNDSRSK